MATLIGGLAGLTLYVITTFINRVLGMDDETVTASDAQRTLQMQQQIDKPARSIADYRAERKKKKQRKDLRGIYHMPTSPTSPSSYASLSELSAGTGDGFEAAWMAANVGSGVSQTILEEDSSSAFG
jgi:hypothetical protein